MSEYRIKGETMTGIADAIRKKTGGTEPIPVPDMAAQIEGISGGGGGSSTDVCYVTFKSYDGSEELGKKAVAVGDDCADPIARGVFDRPTRESDAQYDYAFAGWSKNPDNVLDDTALDAVTEDRVVYAVFAAVVRTYTARFLDGETVMSSQQVAYGSRATPPDTAKDGYTFEGWVPADLTVYGDTDFVGNWSKITGLYYLTSVEKTVDGELQNVAINPDGDRLAMAIGGSAAVSKQVVYNISAETPVQLSTGAITSMYQSECDYDDTGAYLMVKAVIGGAGSVYKFNAKGSYGTVGSISVNETTNSRIACAPSVHKYATAIGKYGDYNVRVCNVDTLGTALANTKSAFTSGPADITFNVDGTLIAVCSTYDGDGSKVFNVNDGSLVKHFGTAKANKASFSGDGTKIAISLTASPYVEVYDTTTWVKVCDLSEYMTAAGYAEFVTGTNILVVGSGTTVRAFDMSGSTPQEIENVPVYAGASIKDIVSNHTGTRIAILSSSGVEVWGKA